MKNVGTIIAAVVLALVLVLYMCTFQVRFTEVAIVKTFGKPAATALDEPGLYWKWPRPIQGVVRYDKRLRILEDKTEETRTVDGKNVLLTTFAIWRIVDPSRFHTNFPEGEAAGERALRNTIATHRHSVVGKRTFSEFVSTNPEERKLREIERAIMTLVRADAGKEFGIEVVDFGIKKLGLPKSVTADIFNSMKSHEKAKADRYIAEGNARATDIVASARAVEGRILAAARQKVQRIRNEAQRKVGDYYRTFDEHPELRIFLDQVRTAKLALMERTQLILDTNEAPFNVFDPAVRRRFGDGSMLSEPGDSSGSDGTADE